MAGDRRRRDDLVPIRFARVLTNSPHDRELKSEERLIQAVDRAVKLLEAIADAGGPVALPEIADAAGVNRSTAWRLLATLEHHGLIDRDGRQGYVIGFAAVRIAAAADQRTLVWRARPLMERLAADTGETVGLSVPEHLSLVTLDQIDSPQVVSANWVGRRLPLHCSSNGKLLLAALSPDELNEFLMQPLAALTANTITDPEALRRELDKTRKLGYGVTVEELEAGLHGVSAATRDGLGNPLAFLSISGPVYRIPEPRLADLGELLVSTVSELQERISQR
jgi:DNA-binding IclR family transcriptional regulator